MSIYIFAHSPPWRPRRPLQQFPDDPQSTHCANNTAWSRYYHCTKNTVFEPAEEGVGVDTLALRTIGGLISSTTPEKKISFGHFKLHFARPTDSPDLKKREWLHLITIPAEGQVQVTHNQPISRIFRYEKRLTKDDLRPGESYRMQINPGYLGTAWWCWGDLEGDLKDKKFSAWQEGITPAKAGGD